MLCVPQFIEMLAEFRYIYETPGEKENKYLPFQVDMLVKHTYSNKIQILRYNQTPLLNLVIAQQIGTILYTTDDFSRDIEYL